MARQKNLNNTGVIQNALYPDPIYNNQLQDDSFSDLSYQDTQGVHPRLALPTQTRNLNYNIHRDPPRDWREGYQGTYGTPTPDLYSNEPAMMNLNRDGIMATHQAQDKGDFLNRIFSTARKFSPMAMVMDSFKRPEEMQTAYEAIMGSADDEGYGKYKGNEYRIDDNKIYSELYPHGKNFDSVFGSKSIEEMENEGWGSIGWARDRLQKGKKISKRLHGILQSRGIDKGGNWKDRPTGEGAQFKDIIPTASVPIKKIHHDQGRDTPTPESWNRDQGGGYTTARGFTKADTGGRGHHSWADGGRIGYALAGPVGVEQETDFIEGPQGGEEFQETVVEGQEQPSREQLEALSMEIFQLPLEELDDQQLLVVYQEAMQGQPMEEAVQEEDVQFAANGGLAGLL